MALMPQFTAHDPALKAAIDPAFLPQVPAHDPAHKAAIDPAFLTQIPTQMVHPLLKLTMPCAAIMPGVFPGIVLDPLLIVLAIATSTVCQCRSCQPDGNQNQ